MISNFEEKTYENYFNTELDRLVEVFFPLGQVQEGNLGFDSSAFSHNRRLWRMLGHPFWFFPHFQGLELREIADEMEHFIGRVISEVPKMKANLIFQYKKPEFITISSGTEWKHWNMPYFRYNIYQEQQELLMHIHRTLGTSVLVVYAAPAIHDVNDLVDIHSKRKLIENSNFKKAFELDLHHRNTYIQSGVYSIACSESEKIDNFDLEKELIQFNRESNDNYGAENNKQFIVNFRKQIESIVSENNYYASSFKTLNVALEGLIKYELLYSFLVMINFRQLTGTQWIIKV